MIIEEEAKIGVTGYAQVYKVKQRKELPKKDDIDTFEWLIEKGELISETKNMLLASACYTITRIIEGSYETSNWLVYLSTNQNSPAICESTTFVDGVDKESSITGLACDDSSNPTYNYFYGYFNFNKSFGSNETEFFSTGLCHYSSPNYYKDSRALLSSSVYRGYAFDVLVKYTIETTFDTAFTSHYRETICRNIANRGYQFRNYLKIWYYNGSSWYSDNVDRSYRADYCASEDPSIGYAMWYRKLNYGSFTNTISKIAFSDSSSNPDTAPNNVFWQKNVSFERQNKAYFLKFKITYN